MRSGLSIIFRALIAVSALLSLSACSNLEFPWVYRIDIDQGNIITQDMVNKLRPGMTRDQVKYVMGSPLVIDPFHPDRWDYVYTLRTGKGKRTREQLTVFFKDDTLVSLSGDFLPASAQTDTAPTRTN
ncbi:MAG TPA: outer membrane protein assembly factor BamE [Spongiibacteraceae bacterium]|nr:outer membrane protein assembly factor BamE [Spongiibacteraceae bacterium]